MSSQRVPFNAADEGAEAPLFVCAGCVIPGESAARAVLAADVQCTRCGHPLKAPTDPQPYPPAHEREREGDARFECWFCPGVHAVALAPRHSGGDENVPAHWVPVCDYHQERWHNETDAEDMLPIVPMQGLYLDRAVAEDAHKLLGFFAEDAPLDSPSNDAMELVMDTLEAGLRVLALMPPDGTDSTAPEACGKCGKLNSPEATLCRNCGEDLSYP